MRLARKEEGSALIVTLLVLLALTVTGTALVFYAGSHNEMAVSGRAQDQTLFYADAGVNWGLNWISVNGLAAASAGTSTPVYLLDNGGANVQYPGSSGAAVNVATQVTIGPSFDSKGQGVVCGLIGFSSDLGQPRFMVTSNATGPLNATRSIEAHVLLSPRKGLCPAGTQVVGGYSGST